MPQTTVGGSDWTLRNISLLRGRSNTGAGFLQRWLMPQACQFLRGISTMPSVTGFNFCQPWCGQAVGLDLVGPFQLK